MSWIDNALATSERALLMTSRRAEVLATNLANANTPGYRARDVDFKSILADQELKEHGMNTTCAGHIGSGFKESLASFEREVTTAPAEDGNTVSKEKEQAAYTQNSIRYLAGLRFLDGNVKGLLKALKGQ